MSNTSYYSSGSSSWDYLYDETIEHNKSWCDHDLVMKVNRNNRKTPMGWDSSKVFLYSIEKGYDLRHHYFLDRYAEWYGGTTRVAYVDGDKVLKVPINKDGVNANQLEHAVANRTGHSDRRYSKYLEIPMAMCFLDNQVLIMEKVIPVMDLGEVHPPFYDCEETPCLEVHEKYPDWVWKIDHAQVGYNTSGELVAYDL